MPSSLASISPGRPTLSLQTLATFTFRQRRFAAYASGNTLNVLAGPEVLVQTLSFHEALSSVVADPRSGKLAVAVDAETYILEPVTEGWTVTYWEKALLLRPDAESVVAEGEKRRTGGHAIRWLSWGNDGEILVGGETHMSLFSTLPSSRTHSPVVSILGDADVEVRRPIWSKTVASPLQHAEFSPSTGLIATCGSRDRLVKIWRRLSWEEGLFDFDYLPHAWGVTHLEWRPLEQHPEDNHSNGGRHEDQAEVLFTFATDGLLRVWRTCGMHEVDVIRLHLSLDLVTAIPGSPSLTINGVHEPPKPPRYGFVLPADHFSNAVSSSIGLNLDSKTSHSLEHLKAISINSPDIVVTLDGNGRMSAWGLQNIGHKRRPDSPGSQQFYHIAHTEDFPIKIPGGRNARFRAWLEDARLNLIVHDFEGQVHWWQGAIENIFSPSAPAAQHFKQIARWDGQSSTISGLHSPDGQRLLSWNQSGEVALWRHELANAESQVVKLSQNNAIMDAVLLGSGQILVVLESTPKRLKLMNISGTELDQTDVDLQGECKLVTDEVNADGQKYSRLLIIGAEAIGEMYLISSSSPSFDSHARFDLTASEEHGTLGMPQFVLDSRSVDKFGTVRYNTAGSLVLNHISLSIKERSAAAIQIAVFETKIQEPNRLAVSNDFAVVSSRKNELAIVNLQDGYLEHRVHNGKKEIRNMAICAKPVLVAACYETDVDILVPSRFEYGKDSAWILLKRVSLETIGLTINHIAFLADGALALAAGNGLAFSDGQVSVEGLGRELIEATHTNADELGSLLIKTISDFVRRSLPIWHPTFLSLLCREGRWQFAAALLQRMYEKLTFWSEGDELHHLLDTSVEDFYDGGGFSGAPAVLGQETYDGLKTLLEEKRLPLISRREQQAFTHLLEAVIFCSEHVDGLDNCAMRYLLEWKLQTLPMDKPKEVNGLPNGIHHETTLTAPQMQWREISYAYNSTTQQPLLDILVAHYDNKITWPIANRLGITAWLNSEALAQIFEALAQTTYRSTSPPDPTTATLFFLALHKKPTLLALWRIATWHKEQRATIKFLQRDFSKPEHKTAAKKNAYALMGKRRFDYAAAFFLLADDPASAASVLAGQCDEVMLAIAVARLYSGDGSAILTKLLSDRILPTATERGDRWLMCWCHLTISRRDYAAEVLLQPLDGVAKWQQDDPDLLSFYTLLRKSPSEHEWDSVLRAARILRRMGLWLSAVELVRTWRFQQISTTKVTSSKDTTEEAKTIQSPPSMLDGFGDPSSNQPSAISEKKGSTNGGTDNVPSILDGFTSPKPPATDDKAAREAKAAELLKKLKAKKAETTTVDLTVNLTKPKPPPTQFKEPDPNSLLDSFGF